MMVGVHLESCGWQRDLPDHRDFTSRESVIRKALKKLKPLDGEAAQPTLVDLREFFPPVGEQTVAAPGSAQACVALVQYFERRSSGRLIVPSKEFVHANALKFSLDANSTGIRTVIKSIVRFGLPPERYWRSRESSIPPTNALDPFLYGFAADYRDIQYVRLDASQESRPRSLEIVKSFLAAGYACSLGFVLPRALTDDPHVPFPTLLDSIRGSHVAVIAGYDDGLRIRSEKGALLIRNSWGIRWGIEGYGWLPYRYVLDGLCGDIWTLLKPDWLESGEFARPAISREK